MERVFDICHGCRRCVSLCQSFPTLFDLVDASESLEVDGVAKEDYGKVVEQCYLCDLCYMTKCPYVPPHDWGLDFPHLMLRAKAVAFRKGETKLRDRISPAPTPWAARWPNPVLAPAVNRVNTIAARAQGAAGGRRHPRRRLAAGLSSNPLRKRLEKVAVDGPADRPDAPRQGRAVRHLLRQPQRAGHRPGPSRGLHHNGIPVVLTTKEKCCGMPKLELGDLKAVRRAKEFNIPVLAKLVDEGFDLTALVPSCVLMFKQELPLMFPDDADVAKVKNAFSTRSNISSCAIARAS